MSATRTASPETMRQLSQIGVRESTMQRPSLTRTGRMRLTRADEVQQYLSNPYTVNYDYVEPYESPRVRNERNYSKIRSVNLPSKTRME
jgi:hypothetical protein